MLTKGAQDNFVSHKYHKITLGTCRWTNKEHFPVRMYSHSMRGTKVAMTEGQWLFSKLPECSAPNQMTALRLVCTLCIYPYPMHKHNVCDITRWHHNHLLPFSVGKHCTCTGEPCHFPCTPASIPTNCFLQLRTNHLVNSASRISSLWHLYIGK